MMATSSVAVARSTPAVGPKSTRRPVVRAAFYAVFLASTLLTLVELSPVRMTINIGASQLRETDLLVLTFIGLWALRGLFRAPFQYHHEYRFVHALVVVLVIPVFVGLAVGKAPFVVLRDFRTPVFYLAILPMLSVIRTREDLRRFLVLATVISALTVSAGASCWVATQASDQFGSIACWWSRGNASATTSHRFAISSSLGLSLWLMFLAISLLGFQPVKKRVRGFLKLYIVALLVFVFFGNDVRSIYVGVICASTLVMLFLSRDGHTHRIRRWSRVVVVAVFLTGVTTGFLILLAPSIYLDRDSWVLQDLRLRRLYSLIDPTLGGTLDVVAQGGSNRDDRILGLTYGLTLGARHAGFGEGYGDNTFVDLEQKTIDNLIRRNTLEGNPGNVVENLLLTHNSYGWAFGRLGLWAAIVYFLLVAAIWLRAWIAFRRSTDTPIRVVLSGTMAFTLYLVLIGFGGGAFFDYTGQGLVTWLTCLAVLVRATTLASRRSDPRVVTPTRTEVRAAGPC